MKPGVMKDQLAASLTQADKVFCYAANLGWDACGALAPIAAKTVVEDDLDALVAAIVAEARDGDRVLVMSNGGFGGIHGKLLAALAGWSGRWRSRCAWHREDAEAIAGLVNCAYRPAPGWCGWTHEAELPGRRAAQARWCGLCCGRVGGAGAASRAPCPPAYVEAVLWSVQPISGCCHRAGRVRLAAGQADVACAERYAADALGARRSACRCWWRAVKLIAFYLRRGMCAQGRWRLSGAGRGWFAAGAWRAGLPTPRPSSNSGGERSRAVFLWED